MSSTLLALCDVAADAADGQSLLAAACGCLGDSSVQSWPHVHLFGKHWNMVDSAAECAAWSLPTLSHVWEPACCGVTARHHCLIPLRQQLDGQTGSLDRRPSQDAVTDMLVTVSNSIPSAIHLGA